MRGTGREYKKLGTGSLESASDHVELDPRIRREPADHTATRPYSAQQLRDAEVWWELLLAPSS